jgi:excisionase family DNA binding protein
MDCLWNKKQAAQYLNISPLSLTRKVCQREVPFIKFGRRVLFDPEDLRRFVASKKVEVKA